MTASNLSTRASQGNQITYRLPSGQITLLPSRGRVLQVSIGGDDAFWVNPKWDGGWNVGGDRLWVGPEVHWNWKTRGPIDFEKYHIPAAMDPGSWLPVPAGKRSCAARQTITLRHQLQNARAQLEIGRRFEPVVSGGNGTVVTYATENSMRLRGGTSGQEADLWSVLQLPAGGVMYIPCKSRPRYRNYFNPIPRSLWKIDGRVLCLEITGRHQYKIGVPADLTTGRIVYARRVGQKYLVIRRDFFPQPWRRYCDVPLGASRSEGDAVQVYNDGGQFGGFGELEYHTPSMTVGSGTQWLVDNNLTTISLLSARAWEGARRSVLHSESQED
ncbi:MAG: hypothetical protein EXS31_19100 [Pedosphaera sp.]|nr:hypothetical protein [Pedosphaera sp.]